VTARWVAPWVARRAERWTGWRVAWRVSLRLAWREARRSPGRAALVVAMIAVPVLGLTYSAVSYDMFTLTEAEQVDRRLGAADAYVTWQYEQPVGQDRFGDSTAGPDVLLRRRPYTGQQLLALLPAGSRVLPDERPYLTLRTPAGGLAYVEGRGLDLADPMTHGIGRIVDGRAPAGLREVALSPSAADDLHVAVGDTVHSFDDTADWRVVGLVRFAESYGGIVAYRPGDLPGLPKVEPADRRWLVDTVSTLTWPQVRELNRHGVLAEARSVRLDPPAEIPDPPGDSGSVGSRIETAGAVALIGGLGVLEVILLAGPAFAVVPGPGGASWP
jgi:putative ABC transport system permease protein